MEAQAQEEGKVWIEMRGAGILDLDLDSLVHCVSNLKLCDLANMAIACKRLRDTAYTDTIWELQCRKRWPAKQMSWGVFQYSGGRGAYLARHIASQQFRFLDPVDWQFNRSPAQVSHILFEDDSVLVAQGPSISKWKIGSSTETPYVSQILSDHNARITCMRLFPLAGLASFRNMGENASKLLVTSSCDHTIRLWGKGRSLRTLRGHSGPVTTLADRFLGKEYGSSVLATGGMDGTVKLWTLSSSNKRGRSPLQATFHGHEQAIKELVAAEHNPSLLVSAAKDSKIRVWDVTSSSATGAGGCLGSARGPGVPVGMKSSGALCYVAGGSAVVAVDLRSMQNVATIAVHEPGILTLAMSVTEQAICTGGIDRTARLWDLRTCQQPYAVLENHMGPIHCVHVDSYKVVTGGSSDRHVHVWDTKTGSKISSFDSLDDTDLGNVGVIAMAVDGTRIVTGTCGDTPGVIRLRDFSNCAVALVQVSSEASSNAETPPQVKVGNEKRGKDIKTAIGKGEYMSSVFPPSSIQTGHVGYLGVVNTKPNVEHSVTNWELSLKACTS